MEYKCGSCREVSALSPRAKFCPVCGSSSLVLVVKELAEPMQKETIGVYKSATINDFGPDVREVSAITETEPSADREEEDRPRHKR